MYRCKTILRISLNWFIQLICNKPKFRQTQLKSYKRNNIKQLLKRLKPQIINPHSYQHPYQTLTTFKTPI